MQREIRQSGISGAMIGKGNHRHFMLKEIHEQPAVIGDTLHTYLDPATRKVTLPALPFDWTKVSRLTMTACGTAFYACMVAKYWFEQLARLPVEVEVASELRYREPPLPEDGVCIAVSQSGETVDTLAAIRYAKANKQTILSVVNVPESAIARESHGVLPTLAGPEIGVASTKAFTTQLTVLLTAAIAAGRARGTLSEADEAKLAHALIELPAHINEALNKEERLSPHLRGGPRRGARRALSRPRHLVPDRARGRAEAQGDLLHPRRGLCRRRDEARADRADRRAGAGRGGGADRRPVRQDRLELRAGQGARRQAGADERRRGRGAARRARPRPRSPCRRSIRWWRRSSTPIPVQLLAYHTAVAKGTDVDQPRNLAKSVTVE